MYKRHQDNDFGDVGRFHTKFGLPNVNDDGPGPKDVDPELLRFRIKFLLEEILEFIEAAGYELRTHDGQSVNGDNLVLEQSGLPQDHAKMFDALLDEAYVVFGTAHIMGYPWQDGWDRVQQANMAKVRAQADGSDSKRGSSFDVVKPEGWRPPDIEGLLQAYGFNINQAPAPKQYGHDREGYQCVPEVCGGSRLDPCTYTPEEIARFEAEAEKEFNQ